MPMENALKNTEMTMEDDYGMIDGIINNGQKTTTEKLTPETAKQLITELAEAFRLDRADQRQSVLQQLKIPNEQAEKRTAPKRAEMER